MRQQAEDHTVTKGIISTDAPNPPTKARKVAEAEQALTHFQLPPTKNCRGEAASISMSALCARAD
jgi:hypothetical protein